MGKTLKLILCGSCSCGKTSIVEQLIYGAAVNNNNNGNVVNATALHSTNSDLHDGHTTEDTYVAHIESDRGVKEKVRFYEVGGSPDVKSVTLAKHFVAAADAFIFVLDITDTNSLTYLESLKREMDRLKERRDAQVIFLLVNKVDLEPRISAEQINRFVIREKITKSFEVSAMKRRDLMEAFVTITSKITAPVNKTFPFGKRDAK